MGIEVLFEQSHKYSYLYPVKAAFRIIIAPSSAPFKVKGLHYIILLDASGSMKGEKIKAAKKAIVRLLNSIPENNYVTLIVFGLGKLQARSLVVHADVGESRSKIISMVSNIVPDDGTPLYRALRMALEIASSYHEPGYIILVTDGYPTDIEDRRRYAEMKWPKGIRAHVIGVGLDYNKELLALIATKGSGILEHISESEVEKLVEIIESTAIREAYAVNLELKIEPVNGKTRLIGYESSEVFIPVLREENIEFYGEVEIPPMASGEVARIRVSYEDPATGGRETREFAYIVEAVRDKDKYISGINSDIYNNYLYQAYMEEAYKYLLKGNIGIATRRLIDAENQAMKTRRLDLITVTKKLVELAEATKSLEGAGAEEATRKLLSESTKRLRSI